MRFSSLLRIAYWGLVLECGAACAQILGYETGSLANQTAGEAGSPAARTIIGYERGGRTSGASVDMAGHAGMETNNSTSLASVVEVGAGGTPELVAAGASSTMGGIEFGAVSSPSFAGQGSSAHSQTSAAMTAGGLITSGQVGIAGTPRTSLADGGSVAYAGRALGGKSIVGSAPPPAGGWSAGGAAHGATSSIGAPLSGGAGTEGSTFGSLPATGGAAHGGAIQTSVMSNGGAGGETLTTMANGGTDNATTTPSSSCANGDSCNPAVDLNRCVLGLRICTCSLTSLLWVCL